MNSLAITEYYSRQRQQEHLDEAQRYRLASQMAARQHGIRPSVTGTVSLIWCRLKVRVGLWRQLLDRTRAQPALQGSETHC
jgi:hypothetical protein